MIEHTSKKHVVIMSECLFCQIANKKTDTKLIYEDAQCVAFNDINPLAPVHILLVPKRHITSLACIKADDSTLLGDLLTLCPLIAHQANLHTGFRTIINTGKGGGQVIDHLHIHILGGGAIHPMPQ